MAVQRVEGRFGTLPTISFSVCSSSTFRGSHYFFECLNGLDVERALICILP